MSLACLECPVDGRGLEPLIITAPTHATDEIWSSSETTMHNGPGSGNIDAINTESRFRAQVENLLDAHALVQMARRRSCAGLAETCQLCVIVPVPANRPPSISLRLIKWGWSPPISQSPKALIRTHRGGHASPANGLALSDQPSRITLQRPLMVCFSTWVKSKKEKIEAFLLFYPSLWFSVSAGSRTGIHAGPVGLFTVTRELHTRLLAQGRRNTQTSALGQLNRHKRAPSSVRDGVLAFEGLRWP